MSKESNTTALARQTELVHGSTLCSDDRRAVEVDQITLLWTSLCLAEALDHLLVGLPLSREGQIADTAHRDTVVHCTVLLFRATGSVFLVCPKKQ